MNELTREQLFKMRYNEFGFSPVSYLGSDRDDFPNRFHIVVHQKTEPRKVFSIQLNDYVLSTENCYVIGELNWDTHEPGWEFSSCGTRYLEYGTTDLNKWIFDFTEKYEINEDGILVERTHE